MWKFQELTCFLWLGIIVMSPVSKNTEAWSLGRISSMARTWNWDFWPWPKWVTRLCEASSGWYGSGELSLIADPRKLLSKGINSKKSGSQVVPSCSFVGLSFLSEACWENMESFLSLDMFESFEFERSRQWCLPVPSSHFSHRKCWCVKQQNHNSWSRKTSGPTN